MNDKTKLSLIDALIGSYYESCYDSKEAGDVMIDCIYNILIFEEEE